jgi:hypothetical protein
MGERRHAEPGMAWVHAPERGSVLVKLGHAWNGMAGDSLIHTITTIALVSIHAQLIPMNLIPSLETER